MDKRHVVPRQPAGHRWGLVQHQRHGDGACIRLRDLPVEPAPPALDTVCRSVGLFPGSEPAGRRAGARDPGFGLPAHRLEKCRAAIEIYVRLGSRERGGHGAARRHLLHRGTALAGRGKPYPAVRQRFRGCCSPGHDRRPMCTTAPRRRIGQLASSGAPRATAGHNRDGRAADRSVGPSRDITGLSRTGHSHHVDHGFAARRGWRAPGERRDASGAPPPLPPPLRTSWPMAATYRPLSAARSCTRCTKQSDTCRGGSGSRDWAWGS